MLAPESLLPLARAILRGGPDPDEAARRRAVSTAYYALFHVLAQAAAAAACDGDEALRAQIARTMQHAAARGVCEKLCRSRATRLENGLSELAAIALTFVELQGARIVADYDLSDELTPSDALKHLHRAEEALRLFAQIGGRRETKSFLAALLFADRWGRRG